MVTRPAFSVAEFRRDDDLAEDSCELLDQLLGVRPNRNRIDKSEHSNEEPVRTLVDAVLVVAFHDHDEEHAKCQPLNRHTSSYFDAPESELFQNLPLEPLRKYEERATYTYTQTWT
jgi:hypothetical protein